MQALTLIERIDAVLPQTQCTKCGYEGCLPYARALATEGEAINRCPPGGSTGIHRLAEILTTPALALDPECGQEQAPLVAVIDEAHCIGCTLCIQACPVDAIVGANKLMHTVLADRCTGCDLCVAPCPVDCIDMVPADRDWTSDRAADARAHHRRRQERVSGQHNESSALAARTLANKAVVATKLGDNPDHKQKIIAEALAKARARRKKDEPGQAN